MFKIASILLLLSLLNQRTQNQRINSSNRNRYIQKAQDEPWVWGGSNPQSHRQTPRPYNPRSPQNPQRQISTTQTNSKGCGEAPLLKINGRITGGREAFLGEYPWQVSLLQKNGDDYSHICGAAILNEWWVITAAHCLEEVKAEDLKIAVGTHDISKIRKSDERSIDRIIRHEKYNKGSGGELINDIALLHVSSKIDLNNPGLARSVCLPEQGQRFIRNLEVSGWGRTAEYGFESQVLRTVEVFVKSNNECSTNLQGRFRPKEMFCAGVDRGGKDACQGDSGGPIVKRRNKIATLAGIVSYGIGCGRKGRPGVYTRVSNYVNWINKHIN